MTKLYPSQQNRSPINIDTSIKNDFKQWCLVRDLDMKSTLEALIQMCLEGELQIQSKIQVKKRDDNDYTQ